MLHIPRKPGNPALLEPSRISIPRPPALSPVLELSLCKQDYFPEVLRLASDLEGLEEVSDGAGYPIEEFAPVYARFLALVRAGVPFAAMFIDWMRGMNEEAQDLPDDSDQDYYDDHLEPAEPEDDQQQTLLAAARWRLRDAMCHGKFPRNERFLERMKERYPSKDILELTDAELGGVTHA